MHDLQNEKLVGKSIGLAADCLDFRDLHEVGGSDSILSTFAVIDHQRQERDKKPEIHRWMQWYHSSGKEKVLPTATISIDGVPVSRVLSFSPRPRRATAVPLHITHRWKNKNAMNCRRKVKEA